MKKYSVFSLYVVEKNGHKFICERFCDNSYREVLTKTKIFIEDSKNIESLTNWYSLLEVALYDKKLNIKKPLMLTKKDILLKYLEINDKTLDKEIPYKVVPIDKTLTDEEMRNILIDMWQTYVESKKDSLPDIPIINAKELKKIKKQ